jgi:hypothetical protein
MTACLGNDDALYRKKSSVSGHAADPALKFTGRYAAAHKLSTACVHRLFGGLIADLKRRAPHYVSDFTDAFNPQCLATFFFMYFALLAPIVTFGGLLEESTGQRMVSFGQVYYCSTVIALSAPTGCVSLLCAIQLSGCARTRLTCEHSSPANMKQLTSRLLSRTLCRVPCAAQSTRCSPASH